MIFLPVLIRGHRRNDVFLLQITDLSYSSFKIVVQFLWIFTCRNIVASWCKSNKCLGNKLKTTLSDRNCNCIQTCIEKYKMIKANKLQSIQSITVTEQQSNNKITIIEMWHTVGNLPVMWAGSLLWSAGGVSSACRTWQGLCKISYIHSFITQNDRTHLHKIKIQVKNTNKS